MSCRTAWINQSTQALFLWKAIWVWIAWKRHETTGSHLCQLIRVILLCYLVPVFFRTTQLTMGFIMSQRKDPDKPTNNMESRMVFQCSFRASSFVQQISNAAPSILCSCLPKPRTRTCIGLSSHWHWAQRYEVTRWRWRSGGFSKQKAPLLFRFIRLKPGFWRWKRSMPPQYTCCWVINIYVYMCTIFS